MRKYFKKVEDWFEAGEGVKNHGLAVDSDGPWTNAIHMDFGPREEWGLTWSK